MTQVYKKIMVTLDGSDFAAQALPRAQALAECFGAKLILFRVVLDVYSADVGHIRAAVTGVDRKPDEQQQHLIDEALEPLIELQEELKLHQLEVQAVVDTGPPAVRIIDYAAENEVDLIVMTTHGRTRLARWVFGSVAEKVLRGAPCSVFLVRAALTTN